MKTAKAHYMMRYHAPLHDFDRHLRWVEDICRDGSVGEVIFIADQFHMLLAVITGYLGWQMTIDGLKTSAHSGGDWLRQKRHSQPDFATLARQDL